MGVAQFPRARAQCEQQSSPSSWRSIHQCYKPRVPRRGIRQSQTRRDELEQRRKSLVEEGSHWRWQDLAESTQVAIIEQSNNPFPKMLSVQYNPTSQFRAPLIIQVPATPTYRDNHVVPLRYNEVEIIFACEEKASSAKEVTNIARIGRVMRSERVLNKAHVAQDITIEKFGGIVNNITASSHLSFLEDEVLAMGRGHNQPLHIFVKCGDYMIAMVLIDNGSSLNFMPKATLEKLYSTQLRANSIVMKVFDRSKREVMGEIKLIRIRASHI
ncbi:hypothetical protein CR513_30523, partial [Mucuna pruriens]